MMKKSLLLALILMGGLLGVAAAAHYGVFRVALRNGDTVQTVSSKILLGPPEESDLSGTGTSIENHPSGARFYQRDWPEGGLGTVEFVHSKHSFTIDNVLSILGSADKDVPGGIYDWIVNLGVSSQQADTRKAALAGMMQLFAKLRAAGWVRYIDADFPRLNGKQAWDYRSYNSIYPLDPSYAPSVEEWEAVVRAMPKWEFYADGVYLKISIIESSMGAVAGRSTYLISIEAFNEYAFYGLGYFPGNAENIRNWKELLPAELQKYHADRIKAETELKSQGYAIDTTYQDPPIKALQEPSADRK